MHIDKIFNNHRDQALNKVSAINSFSHLPQFGIIKEMINKQSDELEIGFPISSFKIRDPNQLATLRNTFVDTCDDILKPKYRNLFGKNNILTFSFLDFTVTNDWHVVLHDNDDCKRSLISYLQNEKKEIIFQSVNLTITLSATHWYQTLEKDYHFFRCRGCGSQLFTWEI